MQEIPTRLDQDFEPNCVLPTAKLNISRQVYHDKHVTLKTIFGVIVAHASPAIIGLRPYHPNTQILFLMKENTRNSISTGESRFKKDLNLQIHLLKLYAPIFQICYIKLVCLWNSRLKCWSLYIRYHVRVFQQLPHQMVA